MLLLITYAVVGRQDRQDCLDQAGEFALTGVVWWVRGRLATEAGWHGPHFGWLADNAIHSFRRGIVDDSGG